MNGFFNTLTNWLYETPFYKEHMINWPSPLNDASFDLFLLFVIVLVLVLPEVIDRVRNAIAYRRIRKKSPAPKEERCHDPIPPFTQEELMEQYLRFLILVKIKRLEMEVSFEQYRRAKLEEAAEVVYAEDGREENKEKIIKEIPLIETIPEEPIPVITKQEISDVNALLARKAEEEGTDPPVFDAEEISEFSAIIQRIKRTSEEKTKNEAYEKEKEIRFRENASATSERLRAILSSVEKTEEKTVTVSDPALEKAKQNALKAREKEEEKQRKHREKAEKRQERKRAHHEKEEAEIPCD